MRTEHWRGTCCPKKTLCLNVPRVKTKFLTFHVTWTQNYFDDCQKAQTCPAGFSVSIQLQTWQKICLENMQSPNLFQTSTPETNDRIGRDQQPVQGRGFSMFVYPWASINLNPMYLSCEVRNVPLRTPKTPLRTAWHANESNNLPLLHQFSSSSGLMQKNRTMILLSFATSLDQSSHTSRW